MSVMSGSVRHRIALLVVVLVACGVTTAASAQARPPRGISGRAAMYWNVDALVRDVFGSHPVCLRRSSTLVRQRSAYCAMYYTRLFPSARHSGFHLARRTSDPLVGINVVPIRFYTAAGPYVSCGRGRWLALTNARSQLWPIACVKP
jgi:hypothetical protein